LLNFKSIIMFKKK